MKALLGRRDNQNEREKDQMELIQFEYCNQKISVLCSAQQTSRKTKRMMRFTFCSWRCVCVCWDLIFSLVLAVRLCGKSFLNFNLYMTSQIAQQESKRERVRVRMSGDKTSSYNCYLFFQNGCLSYFTLSSSLSLHPFGACQPKNKHAYGENAPRTNIKYYIV